MSFFNDQSSCQTSSNPLNKILDSSIDHSQFNNFKNNGTLLNNSNIHSLQHIDSSVQNDFNNFSNQLNQSFELSPANMITPNAFNARNGTTMDQSFHLPNNLQANWSQDFNKLSISDNRAQISQPNNQQQQHYNQQQHHNPMNALSSNLYPNQFSSNMQRLHNFNQQQQIPIQASIQSQLHEVNKEFDTMFNEVETELNTDFQSQGKLFDDDLEKDQEKDDTNIELIDEEDKIKFAMLAQNVFNIMNNTPKTVSSQTTDKFKASAFMQLMNKVSNREIEISADKKRLVDQSGSDIRSNLSDPLAGLNLSDTLGSFDAAARVAQSSSIDINANNWQSDFS